MVLATSLSITKTSKKDNLVLEKVLYVHYLIWFKKKKIQVLIDLGSKINIMIPAYVLNLNIKVYYINVGAQKIDGPITDTFGIVSASSQVEDKLKRARFFQETFLLADISVEMVLNMLLFTFSNIDI